MAGLSFPAKKALSMKITASQTEANELALRLDRIRTDVTAQFTAAKATGFLHTIDATGKTKRRRLDPALASQLQANVDALWVAAEAMRGNFTITPDRPFADQKPE